MFAITADQRSSRRGSDLVPTALDGLGEIANHSGGVLLPFERTVGDEIQGLVRSPATTVEIVLTLLRTGLWSVGVGLGAVDEPVASSARASRGPAFIRAREAVEAAKVKGLTQPLAVVGAVVRSDEGSDDGADGSACDDAIDSAQQAQALLRLLGAVRSRRSAAGWEACDAMRQCGGNQSEVAARLGITPQAVSDRLQAALYQAETECHSLAVQLLTRADAAASAGASSGAAGSRAGSQQPSRR